jgi:hypothetical protein
MTGAEPLPQIIDEARRVLGAAREHDVPLRLIGGLAVKLRAGDALHPAFAREYKDIDVVTLQRSGRAVEQLLASLGYVGDREFNALNGKTRLLFFDHPNHRQLDVFVGAFEMCHRIPITDRILREETTIPLAELLLSKLQIVKINEKDMRDTVALLHHHEIGDEDGATINASYIAELCSADWGLWRTCTLNLERVRTEAEAYELDEHERAAVKARIDLLLARIHNHPKSTRWKLREKVGERKRWYLDPEEVNE